MKGKKVMSCERMESRILGYVDGRLKESERLEVEKHLLGCEACAVRVAEFRAVGSLLEELPQIEPSPAFDARVHARVAAEPVKRSWWPSFLPAPRVAFAAALLALAMVWIGWRPGVATNGQDEAQTQQDLPVLENYDVLSSFAPLTELPQPVQTEDTNQQM
jgi:anti-sigma factor RsiW